MNNEIEIENKKLKVAEDEYSLINDDVLFLQEQIYLLNEKLELKRSHLANAQLALEAQRKIIAKLVQTAGRFAQA